jgi:hypothetical protein
MSRITSFVAFDPLHRGVARIAPDHGIYETKSNFGDAVKVQDLPSEGYHIHETLGLHREECTHTFNALKVI